MAAGESSAGLLDGLQAPQALGQRCRGPRRRLCATALWCASAASVAAGQQASGSQAGAEGGVVQNNVPSDVPGPGWPGASAAGSHAAFPSGVQPLRLGAWPQTGAGTDHRVLKRCWKQTVLEDVQNGWPDLCLNLVQATAIQDEASCKAACWDEPRCAVWQFDDVPDGGLQCWVGAGTDCGNRNGEAAPKVIGGQRIMHGDVLVLKNMSGPLVRNLYNLGTYHSGTEETAIMRCRGWCYSLISCQYWQYGVSGCWVDSPYLSTAKWTSPDSVVQYPLTTSGLDPSLQMTAGEYIEHYCPPEPAPPPVVAPTIEPFVPLGRAVPYEQDEAAPGSDGSSMWLWGLVVLVVVAVLLLVAGLMSAGVGKRQGKRGARTRDGDQSEGEELEGDGYGTVAEDDQKPLIKAQAPAINGTPQSSYRGAPAPVSTAPGRPADQFAAMDRQQDGRVSKQDFVNAFNSGSVHVPPGLIQTASNQLYRSTQGGASAPLYHDPLMGGTAYSQGSHGLGPPSVISPQVGYHYPNMQHYA